jgi:hypothetical protein
MKETSMTTKLGACLTALTVAAVLAIPGRATAQQQKDTHYPYVLIDLGTFGGPQAAVGTLP